MNVLKPFKKTTLFTLLLNGVSQHTIARNTGVDRKTIRKYQTEFRSQGDSSNSPMATGFLNSTSGQGPPNDSPPKKEQVATHKTSISACAPHHDWIIGEIDKGRNAMSIYQDLVETFGFTHRYNSVKRYIGKIKIKQPEQYDRLDFLPGEEAQVDYGQGAFTIHPRTGKRRRPRLFVMTLRYSRRSFRKVVWNSSKETWAKLHEEAFRYFGGVPQYVVLDNLKEGVLKPDIYDPSLNTVYAAMLAHYRVVADPCRVADPDRKGTVENAIQHTQTTALKGREFDTIEEQNEWLMRWEENWAAKRIHGRTKRQVQEMFEEEKPHLRALPLQGFRYFEEGVRTVWDDGLIEIKSAYYAAAPARLFSEVLVRIYETEVEIYNPQTLELYRRHPIAVRKGAVAMVESDRIFNPSRQTSFFLEQARQIGPKTRELCEILFTEEGRTGQRRMRGIVALAKRHLAADIEEASSLALECCARSSSVVRRLVEGIEKKRDQEKQATPQTDLTQKHALIRDPSDYGRFWNAHAQIDLFESTKSIH